MKDVLECYRGDYRLTPFLLPRSLQRPTKWLWLYVPFAVRKRSEKIHYLELWSTSACTEVLSFPSPSLKHGCFKISAYMPAIDRAQYGTKNAAESRNTRTRTGSHLLGLDIHLKRIFLMFLSTFLSLPTGSLVPISKKILALH